MLGSVLLTPPLPYWAPGIGNVFSSSPIQSWLGCIALSYVGNLRSISVINRFHLITLLKLRSKCGFENRTSSAARPCKICSYAMTSAWTGLMTVWLNSGLYLFPLTSFHLRQLGKLRFWLSVIFSCQNLGFFQHCDDIYSCQLYVNDWRADRILILNYRNLVVQDFVLILYLVKTCIKWIFV
jgi:hypothetical protein